MKPILKVKGTQVKKRVTALIFGHVNSFKEMKCGNIFLFIKITRVKIKGKYAVSGFKIV